MWIWINITKLGVMKLWCSPRQVGCFFDLFWKAVANGRCGSFSSDAVCADNMCYSPCQRSCHMGMGDYKFFTRAAMFAKWLFSRRHKYV